MFKKYGHRLLLFVTGFYGFVLFLLNYQQYANYGQPVAVNARYLMPIMPVVLYFFAISFAGLFANYRIMCFAPSIVILLLFVIFTQGGGISSFIVVMDTSMQWGDSFTSEFNSKLTEIVSSFVVK